MRLNVCVCTFFLAMFLGNLDSARAGEEAKCAAQYNLDERLILEWAAIGGDPHAQFAIAQCASPLGQTALTQDEKIYALKWSILAVCDSSENEWSVRRDRLTRKLKEEGDLSFRRFGGVTDDEKWTKREKRFQEYRARKRIELEARFSSLIAQASEEDMDLARDKLAADFSRFGAPGVLRLAELTACPSFGASKTFAAAAWQAAGDVWTASGAADFYGARASDRSLAEQSAQQFAALPPAQRRIARLEKTRLLKRDPRMLEQLEDEAALGRLEELTSLGAAIGAPAASPRVLTTAVQFALEALGWIEFVNGPDNDYGPSTIEAAKRAQAHYGGPQSRWLSPKEARRLICDAAVERNDPVSYYHLALMYSQGWGYREDQQRARIAIDRAHSLMKKRLATAEALPNWKQAQYPTYRARIESARQAIAAARSSASADARDGGASVEEAGLCR